MRPLNLAPVKFPSKTNYKMFDRGKRLQNFWEDIGWKGDGKLIQEVQNEIHEGEQEYLLQLEEDKQDYTKLIMEGING